MSEIAETLSRMAAFFEGEGIDYMVIGGYALPLYGRIRATLDIDVAVSTAGEEEHRAFIEAAEDAGYTVNLSRNRQTEESEHRWDESLDNIA